MNSAILPIYQSLLQQREEIQKLVLQESSEALRSILTDAGLDLLTAMEKLANAEEDAA